MADLEQNVTECLDEACALIEEAKGIAGFGSVTDHLDFAEGWLDKARAALEAALRQSPSAAPVAVKVKALEWREARVSDIWSRFEADSPFGCYEAIEWSDGGFGITAPAVPDEDGPRTLSADSMEAAKAAAQADYERRILSEIETPAVQEGWKLVPIDMTEAMDLAFQRTPRGPDYINKVWQAMLDASPTGGAS